MMMIPNARHGFPGRAFSSWAVSKFLHDSVSKGLLTVRFAPPQDFPRDLFLPGWVAASPAVGAPDGISPFIQ